jgi:hypothetical protein
MGARTGHPLPPRRAELREWLSAAGLADAKIGPDPGFAVFTARKP